MTRETSGIRTLCRFIEYSMFCESVWRHKVKRERLKLYDYVYVYALLCSDEVFVIHHIVSQVYQKKKTVRCARL